MATIREQTGEGTLSDSDGIELATVAYRIGPTSPANSDVQTWGGALFFRDAAMILPPGLYVPAIADGTERDIDIEPAGSADGSAREVTFNGVGRFGQRIV